MGVITGFLLKTYTDLLGTLAMTNWFLMLAKVVSTIPYHTSIFKAKFNGSPGSTKDFHGFARGFYHLRHCVTLHSVSLSLSLSLSVCLFFVWADNNLPLFTHYFAFSECV